MAEDPIPRMMPERTGKSRCTRCLALVELAEYLDHDHLCARCAADGDYPLASTPDEKQSTEGKR